MTGVWVAGRQNGSSEDQCADAVVRCVSAYRQQVRYLADEPLLARVLATYPYPGGLDVPPAGEA